MDNNGNGTTSEAIDPPHDSVILCNIPIREHVLRIYLNILTKLHSCDQTLSQVSGYLDAVYRIPRELRVPLHELRYRVRRLLVLIFCWGELCCGSLRETLGGSGCGSTDQRPQ